MPLPSEDSAASAPKVQVLPASEAAKEAASPSGHMPEASILPGSAASGVMVGAAGAAVSMTIFPGTEDFAVATPPSPISAVTS